MGVSDFARWFFPALQAWLSGYTPYSGGFFNPPWALWVLTPLSGFSRTQAFFVWACISILVLFVSMRLLERRPQPLLIAFFLLTPAGFVHLTMGQLTVLLLLGVSLLAVPRTNIQSIGLTLLSLKPHLGLPFLLITHPRTWGIPVGVLLLSLVLQPAWILRWYAATSETPPVAFDYLISMRSLTMGWGFLLILAIVVIAGATYMYLRYKPDRHWTIALLCCIVLIVSPYTRLYDNVLLFYPATLVLRHVGHVAWPALLGIFLLPLIWAIAPWAVFVDWLAPAAMLLVIFVTLRAQHTPDSNTSRFDLSLSEVNQ